jgi:hypothetical protein
MILSGAVVSSQEAATGFRLIPAPRFSSPPSGIHEEKR